MVNVAAEGGELQASLAPLVLLTLFFRVIYIGLVYVYVFIDVSQDIVLMGLISLLAAGVLTWVVIKEYKNRKNC